MTIVNYDTPSKTLEICKQFSENLVNESGNVPRASKWGNIIRSPRRHTC